MHGIYMLMLILMTLNLTLTLKVFVRLVLVSMLCSSEEVEDDMSRPDGPSRLDFENQQFLLVVQGKLRR